MSHHDQTFNDRSEPVPAVEAPTADELDVRLGWTEPGDSAAEIGAALGWPDSFRAGLKLYAPDAADGRAQALSAGLAVILAAPTAKTMRLRAELLRHIAEAGRGESLAQLAKRLGVTARRLQQIRAEIFKFRIR